MGEPMQGRARNGEGGPGFRDRSGRPAGRSWHARAAVGILAGFLVGGDPGFPVAGP